MTKFATGLRPLVSLVTAALVLFAGVTLGVPDAAAQGRVRIKDIADFEGVRQNMLVGYGLVVGLNRTGDSLSNAQFTRRSVIGMLERLGINTIDLSSSLTTNNIAAVMVTATLPPFARQGTKIDVSVSAMGDATSLLGGTLLVTPLLGADGEVYAVAQGTVAISGFTATGAGQSITRGTPTSGRIGNGAIVERETGFQFASLKSINIALRNPDFTTARRIAQAINGFARQPIANATDPATVHMTIPENRTGDLVGLVTDVEQLTVEPDMVARVVIEEKSGTIVMGDKVRVSTVAIAQGQLTIRITETPQVSQPNAFTTLSSTPLAPTTSTQTVPGTTTGAPVTVAPGGATVTVPRTNIEVDDSGNRRLAVLPGTVTLQELVNGLNALGVGPRDLITILQTIKAAGALQAEIEIL
jgi:flagellar P-ring protein precursor FlgI